MKLSACIIVKDEEKHIERCLKSIYPLVQKGIAEIILVDTGSIDKTVQIAEKHTNNIYHYKWNDDFAQARNFSISKAKGEYLLIIDADEEIEGEALNKIVELFNDNEYKKFNAFTFKEKNYINDDLKDFGVFTRAFIFKNSKEFFYIGSIHEQPSIITPCMHLDAFILHYGYIANDKVKEEKFIRNSKLLKLELTKNPNNLYYRYQLAVTYEIHSDLEEAVEEIDTLINIIKNKEYNTLFLLYYSAAARIYRLCGLYSKTLEVCNIGLSEQTDFIDLIYSKFQAFYAMENYDEALKFAKQYLILLRNFKEHDIFHDTRFLFYSLSCKEKVENIKLICSFKTKKIDLEQFIERCNLESIDKVAAQLIIQDLICFIEDFNIYDNTGLNELKYLKNTIDFVFQRTLNSKQLESLSTDQNLYIIDKYLKLGKILVQKSEFLNKEEVAFFKELNKVSKSAEQPSLLNKVKLIKSAVDKNTIMARAMEIYIEELLKNNDIIKPDIEMGKLIKELKSKISEFINQGCIEEAEELIMECEKYCIDEEVYSMKAVLNIMSNKLGEAEKLLIEAVTKYPNSFDLIYNLAYVYEISENQVLALVYYKQSLELCIDKDIKHSLISKIENIESEALDFKSIEKLAHKYLFEKRDLAKALILYKKVLELEPKYPHANYYIAECYLNLENLNKAKHHFEKAMELKEYNVSAFNNYAHLLSKTGENEKAIYYFQKAMERADKKAEMFSNLLLTLNYDSFLNDKEMFLKHLEFGKLIGEEEQKFISYKKSLDLSKKLKIGYISSDFRQHSVMHFISTTIVSHNKKDFEVYCYSDVLTEDGVTKGIRCFSDKWRDICEMDDGEVEKLIRKDDIDVLIDLNGHSGRNRLNVFARKPAPVQITWIGYPNTTGLRNMDYRITDAYVDPEGFIDQYYSEKLIRMPETFLCYAARECPEVTKVIPYFKNNKITFGCFNNMAKITEGIIKLWCDILKKVDNSILVLKNTAFLDEDIINTVKERFFRYEIKEEQLNFIKRDIDTKEHISRYNYIDIALDTYPYNGTTTTCEAMYMGVPVISLAGKNHASRVGVSLLTNVGLEELIAYNVDEYVQKAVDLACDIERLEKIKLNLRDNMKRSSLMQGDNFTKELERVYRNLWIEHCKKI